MAEDYSLYDIGYIHRIVVGNDNPENEPDEERIKEQLALLNKCLNCIPRGKIVAQEKNFYILNIGEHQVVMQYIVYHVGFKRKPYWL